MKLYRVIVPVSNIEEATDFYSKLFDHSGNRVSPGRHYFHCDGVIFACYDAKADGDENMFHPNPDHIYLAVDDLEKVFNIAKSLPCNFIEAAIETRPWGERSFYMKDFCGNPLCIVDKKTIFGIDQ